MPYLFRREYYMLIMVDYIPLPRHLFSYFYQKVDKKIKFMFKVQVQKWKVCKLTLLKLQLNYWRFTKERTLVDGSARKSAKLHYLWN